MQERNLGPSGLRVSLVGLGCNNFGGRIDLEATRKVIAQGARSRHHAVRHRRRLWQPRRLGDALGEVLGDRRKDIVLATKFGMPMDEDGKLKGGSRRYIMSAVEASLRRLKTDWIDLYQLHRPDPHTPIEETLRALDDLVRQGKVRYIGCSNFSGWQIADADWTSRHNGLHRYVSAQNEYSLLSRGDRERAGAGHADAYGIGLLPFFPLASGLLTGKYKRNAPPPEGTRLAGKALADRVMTEANWNKVEKLRRSAMPAARPAELAFSWLAAKPYVASVIAGATKPEQLEQNIRATEWKLSAEELAEVDKITE